MIYNKPINRGKIYNTSEVTFFATITFLITFFRCHIKMCRHKIFQNSFKVLWRKKWTVSHRVEI